VIKVTFLLNNMFYKNKEEVIEAEDANDVIDRFCLQVQDLSCLLRQIPAMGTKKDQKECKKLEAFIEKFYANELTDDDLKSFSLEISTGTINVKEVVTAE